MIKVKRSIILIGSDDHFGIHMKKGSHSLSYRKRLRFVLWCAVLVCNSLQATSINKQHHRMLLKRICCCCCCCDDSPPSVQSVPGHMKVGKAHVYAISRHREKARNGIVLRDFRSQNENTKYGVSTYSIFLLILSVRSSFVKYLCPNHKMDWKDCGINNC